MIFKDPILLCLLGKNNNKLWRNWSRIFASNIQASFHFWNLKTMKIYARLVLKILYFLSKGINFYILCENNVHEKAFLASQRGPWDISNDVSGSQICQFQRFILNTVVCNLIFAHCALLPFWELFQRFTMLEF